jgi:4-hydroxybutyrate CoA-transferase
LRELLIKRPDSAGRGSDFGDGTPDEHGFMSLGTGVDCSADRGAPGPPRDCGGEPAGAAHARRRVSAHQRVSAIVENDHPLREVPSAKPTEVHHRIAAHVASLIPDGATLQTGIGGIPDAVLTCLEHHKDLGIHTEMFSDGVIPLIEAGVINGRRKTLHRASW